MYNPVQIRSFVTAIHEGSLSAAARKLGLTQPAVSQHLNQLERSAGQVLVVRSRNGVRATQAGDVVLRHGQRVLQELTRMSEHLDDLRGEVTGRLSVSTNMLFNQTLLVPLLGNLKRDYPKLVLNTLPTDDFVDVEADGIDIAIRTGQPGNGSGVVRRVAELEMVLIAAPDYLVKEGTPASVQDLAALHYIQYREDPDQSHLDMMVEGQAHAVKITPAFDAQNPNLILHAVHSGLGFARVPRFMAFDALQTGDLIEILPKTPPINKPIFLVQAAHTVEAPRNVLFRKRLFAQIDQSPFMDLTRSAHAEMKNAKTGLDPVVAAT